MVDWKGVFPAVTTQFRADQSLDVEATMAHVERLISSGCHGLIMLGTVGENVQLEAQEKRAVISASIKAAAGRVLNIGSGRSATVREIAALLATTLDVPIEPVLTGQARVGDIRHCFADVELARETLGFEAEVGLEEGIAELVAWLAGQRPDDRVEQAHAELERRGLTL